jgi:hypothetical protein
MAFLCISVYFIIGYQAIGLAHIVTINIKAYDATKLRSLLEEIAILQFTGINKTLRLVRL